MCWEVWATGSRVAMAILNIGRYHNKIKFYLSHCRNFFIYKTFLIKVKISVEKPEIIVLSGEAPLLGLILATLEIRPYVNMNICFLKI